MKNNQKGFSVVETLIVLVIIGLVGGIGWYVYDKQKTNVDTTTSTTVNQQDIPEENSGTDDGTSNQAAEAGKFSGKVKLPNGNVTTLSFNYDDSWTYEKDDGEALTFNTASEVVVTVSYARGGSAPGGSSEVTHGSNKYRKYQWDQTSKVSTVRYLPGFEEADFNSDGIQFISVDGSKNLLADADKQAEVLLKTLSLSSD